MFTVQYLKIDSITDAYSEKIVETEAEAFVFILDNADSIQLVFGIYETEE